jgi:hypothetical protein
MINISDKSVEKSNKFYIQKLLSENHSVYQITWGKNDRARQATDDK